MSFDFKKEYKGFYLPKAKPEIVVVPRANYIAVRGQGDPNEEGGAYQRAIGVLYAVAYTLKICYGWRRKFTDAIPNDSDALNLLPVNPLCLVHIHLLHKFPDDFSGEFLHIRILAYKGQEVVNIDGAVFLGGKQRFQFCHPALQPLLLLFMGWYT